MMLQRLLSLVSTLLVHFISYADRSPEDASVRGQIDELLPRLAEHEDKRFAKRNLTEPNSSILRHGLQANSSAVSHSLVEIVFQEQPGFQVRPSNSQLQEHRQHRQHHHEGHHRALKGQHTQHAAMERNRDPAEGSADSSVAGSEPIAEASSSGPDSDGVDNEVVKTAPATEPNAEPTSSGPDSSGFDNEVVKAAATADVERSGILPDGSFGRLPSSDEAEIVDNVEGKQLPCTYQPLCKDNICRYDATLVCDECFSVVRKHFQQMSALEVVEAVGLGEKLGDDYGRPNAPILRANGLLATEIPSADVAAASVNCKKISNYIMANKDTMISQAIALVTFNNRKKLEDGSEADINWLIRRSWVPIQTMPIYYISANNKPGNPIPQPSGEIESKIVFKDEDWEREDPCVIDEENLGILDGQLVDDFKFLMGMNYSQYKFMIGQHKFVLHTCRPVNATASDKPVCEQPVFAGGMIVDASRGFALQKENGWSHVYNYLCYQNHFVRKFPGHYCRSYLHRNDDDRFGEVAIYCYGLVDINHIRDNFDSKAEVEAPPEGESVAKHHARRLWDWIHKWIRVPNGDEVDRYVFQVTEESCAKAWIGISGGYQAADSIWSGGQLNETFLPLPPDAGGQKSAKGDEVQPATAATSFDSALAFDKQESDEATARKLEVYQESGQANGGYICRRNPRVLGAAEGCQLPDCPERKAAQECESAESDHVTEGPDKGQSCCKWEFDGDPR